MSDLNYDNSLWNANYLNAYYGGCDNLFAELNTGSFDNTSQDILFPSDSSNNESLEEHNPRPELVDFSPQNGNDKCTVMTMQFEHFQEAKPMKMIFGNFLVIDTQQAQHKKQDNKFTCVLTAPVPPLDQTECTSENVPVKVCIVPSNDSDHIIDAWDVGVFTYIYPEEKAQKSSSIEPVHVQNQSEAHEFEVNSDDSQFAQMMAIYGQQAYVQSAPDNSETAHLNAYVQSGSENPGMARSGAYVQSLPDNPGMTRSNAALPCAPDWSTANISSETLQENSNGADSLAGILQFSVDSMTGMDFYNLGDNPIYPSTESDLETYAMPATNHTQAAPGCVRSSPVDSDSSGSHSKDSRPTTPVATHAMVPDMPGMEQYIYEDPMKQQHNVTGGLAAISSSSAPSISMAAASLTSGYTPNNMIMAASSSSSSSNGMMTAPFSSMPTGTAPMYAQQHVQTGSQVNQPMHLLQYQGMPNQSITNLVQPAFNSTANNGFNFNMMQMGNQQGQQQLHQPYPLPNPYPRFNTNHRYQAPRHMPRNIELTLEGNLFNMMTGWTPEECSCGRRIVEFWRQVVVEGDVMRVHAGFYAVGQKQYRTQRLTKAAVSIANLKVSETMSVSPAVNPDHTIAVSCIYWGDRNDFFITSVDCINLLEGLICSAFSVDEKNRVRRNLEGYRPLTVTKSKPECAGFFQRIMAYPEPRPRNIEKDVKVYSWRTLSKALRKIVKKYTTAYNTPNMTHA